MGSQRNSLIRKTQNTLNHTFEFSNKFLAFTDASNYGIGALFSQSQDEKEVVIEYASRHLSKT